MVNLFQLWTTWLRLLAIAAFLCCGSVSLAAEATAPRTHRLHVSWSSPQATQWSGRVKIRGGRFTAPRSSSFDATEPGTLWIDRGDLRIQHRTARKRGGLRVTAIASERASLYFNFCSADGRTHEFEIVLADVLDRSGGISIENGSLKLAIDCPDARGLRVEVPRDHLIYQPAEQLHAVLHLGSRFGFSRNTSATLSWRLTPARSTQVVATDSRSISISKSMRAIPLEFPLPTDEGVYDAHFKITAATGTITEARIQLVVVDDAHKAKPNPTAEPKLVDEFDPAATLFFRKLAAHGSSARMKRPTSKTLQISPVTKKPSLAKRKGDQQLEENAWIVYRLKIQQPGKPHRLVVHIPAHVDQQLGIALLQPNAAGQLMPTGIHTGFHSKEATVATPQSDADKSARHELPFWPQDREAILLLHSLDASRAIEFGEIQVFQDATLQASYSENQDQRQRRWIAPSLNKPLLAEMFGASETYDPRSRRSLDDWVTFHQASQRLSGYLRKHGYPAIMLAVTADGSAIYPNRSLAPTPRYDTGSLHSAGQDPLRKDVVELLLRVFDRDGLLLVPQLQFSTPLPHLERKLADGGAAARGIELIGRRGKSWREQHGSVASHAPYYNPLDPRVQQAVLAVVKEFVDRYHTHNALAGMALELSNHGYLHLPSLEWGYDDKTISRFRAATGVVIPKDRSKNRFQHRYDFLTNQAAEEWTQWRCEQLAAFHRQLIVLLTTQRPDARIFFDCTNLLEADAGDASRSTVGRLEAQLREKGLNFELYQNLPQLTILRPIRLNSQNHTGGGNVDSANHDPAIDMLFQHTTRGTLINHAPHETPMPDLSGHLPARIPFDWILSQPTLPGGEIRRYLAHTLAAHDPLTIFYRGWMIPLGQEVVTRDLRDVISALPAVRFHDISRKSQPVVVRVARDGEQTHLYAVNDSAGEVKVKLSLSCSSTTECRRLGASGIQLRSSRTGKGSLVTFKLPPYGVWAATFEAANLRVTEADVQLSPAMLKRLATTIDDFQKRMGRSKRSDRTKPQQVVQAGFESKADGTRALPGWDLPDEQATSWTLDSKNPRSGQAALRLATFEEQPASVLSPPLLTRGHRFMTTALWMRSDRDDADVKLTLQGQHEGQPYSRTARIQVGKTWQQYFFRVPNLPRRGLDDVRLRVDAVAGGRLWIDDIEIKTHRLTPENSRQLSKTLAAAKLALNDHRYADCQRLLDSYWGRYLLDEQQVSLSKKDERVKFSERLRRIFRR